MWWPADGLAVKTGHHASGVHRPGADAGPECESSGRPVFFKRRGLHLSADHPYRVVAVYDNPTKAAIPDGAMAFMAGPFMPDNMGDWPAIDSGSAAYQEDLADVLGQNPHAGHGRGRLP